MAKRPLKTPQLPPGDRLAFFRWMHRLILEGGDKPTAAIAVEVHFSAQAVHKALTGPRIPGRLMTERIARTQGGEHAVEPALQLWTAAVAEERSTSRAASRGTEFAAGVPLDRHRPAWSHPERREGGSAAEHGESSDRPTAGSGGSAEWATAGSDDSAEQRNSDQSRTSPNRRERVTQAEPSPIARAAVLDKPSVHQPAATLGDNAGADASLAGLSPREQEVLRVWLLTESKDVVAQQLHLSPSTVATHLQRIRAKYAAIGRPAATKAALVARAVEHGLLSLDEL